MDTKKMLDNREPAGDLGPLYPFIVWVYVELMKAQKLFSSASWFVNIGRGQIYSATCFLSLSFSDAYHEPIRVD
ncbi:hypothetical protein JHK86_010630 [Glycine max]|nr:hypothetical protein JHK86_010630 [Glycine max]